MIELVINLPPKPIWGNGCQVSGEETEDQRMFKDDRQGFRLQAQGWRLGFRV